MLPSPLLAQDWATLNSRGLEYYNNGDYILADSLLQKALNTAGSQHGKVSEEYITSLNNIAHLIQNKGELNKAVESFHQLGDLSKSLYGSTSIEYIQSLTSKANVFLTQGKYDSCEANLILARRLIFAEVDQQTFAYKQNSLLFFESLAQLELSYASMLYNRGQLFASIGILEYQKSSLKKAYDDTVDNSKTYFGILSNLSVYYLEIQQLEKAAAILKKTIAFEDKKYGVNSNQYFDSQNSLASVYRKVNSSILSDSFGFWSKRIFEKRVCLVEKHI